MTMWLRACDRQMELWKKTVCNYWSPGRALKFSFKAWFIWIIAWTKMFAIALFLFIRHDVHFDINLLSYTSCSFDWLLTFICQSHLISDDIMWCCFLYCLILPWTWNFFQVSKWDRHSWKDRSQLILKSKKRFFQVNNGE